MQFSTFQPSLHSFFTSPLLFPYPFIPENYVRWVETPESHIYSADIPGIHVFRHEDILFLLLYDVTFVKNYIPYVDFWVSGVRKEDIRVEVEDSKYLIIRTESADDMMIMAGRRTFMKKFRLPDTIDINGISAGYENGVLTVTVPKSYVRREFYIEPADLPEQLEVLARAA